MTVNELMNLDFFINNNITILTLALFLWSLFVELPKTFDLLKKISDLKKSYFDHLDKNFPPYWNYGGQEIKKINIDEWLDLSNLNYKETKEYLLINENLKTYLLIIFLAITMTGNFWLLLTLSFVVNNCLTSLFYAHKNISIKIFDLKEQVWITRNKKQLENCYHSNFDELPIDYKENPLVVDNITENTSYLKLLRKDELDN